MIVMCNAPFIEVADCSRVSAPLIWLGGWVFAVEVSESQALSVTEEVAEQCRCWWIEIGRSCADWDRTPWARTTARREGLFRWIFDAFNISTERNISAVIGDICEFENKDAVELFNWLASGKGNIREAAE